MAETLPKHHYSIAMLLLPGFNSLSALAFIDPFRAANYLHGESVYHWDWLSLERQGVTASNGLQIDGVSTYIDNTENYDFVVINASWSPEQFSSAELGRWLVRQSRNGCVLIGIDTGSFVLGYAGLLEGYNITVHYEHIAAFRELFPKTRVSENLYTLDRNRFSSCGGLASIDLALEIIRTNQGIDLANASARYIFHERLRTESDFQLSQKHEPVGYSVPYQVREAILLMERNLEEPLSVPEIASHSGLSQRQLERSFRLHTGVSPLRYYNDVRLDRARGLVTQTEMRIVEIAGACGFRSSESFSRAYRKRFQLSPVQDRSEGRVPFHFRSYPSHSGISVSRAGQFRQASAGREGGF